MAQNQDSCDGTRTAPAQGAAEPAAIAIDVHDGVACVTLPGNVDAPVLEGLRLALLDALDCCPGVVVDWGGVERCDIFLHQLLCAGQRAAAARGLSFAVAGTLDPYLRDAAVSMGFTGCGGQGDLYAAT